MVNDNYLYKSPTHVANLNEMRLSGKLCDVTAKVEQSELRAHKVILAANLKYFESMFLNSFEESKQDIVTMKDVHASDLEAFIIYAYTGEMLLTKNNALGLLVVADYLNEVAIKKACVDFLEIYLDVSDAFRAYKLANAVDCLSLKNASKLRIQSNFGDCSQTTEYLNLDFESLKDVMNEARFDDNESQQLFFEGIMRWIMHGPKGRRIRVNDLLRLVNVTKLAAGYLVNYLSSMADHSDDDYGIVKDMMSYYRRCSKIEQLKSPVKNSAEVLMLLGHLKGKRFFHVYNFMEKKWSPLQEIPDDRGNIYPNSVILHDRLYYIGYKSPIYTFEVFNPTTNQTTTLNSPYKILRYSALSACNKFLFICGGRKGFSPPERQILRYDPQTNSVKELAPMRTTRSGAAAIFYQGHLHVLGGYDDNAPINSVEKYDFDTENWTEFLSMIVQRVWHAVAALDRKLYACGGYTSTKDEISNEVEVYDPAKNSWQLVASMNKERDEFLLVAHEGKLWAIGGDKEKTTEVYDPSIDQWQMDDEMSSGLRMQNPVGVQYHEDADTMSIVEFKSEFTSLLKRYAPTIVVSPIDESSKNRSSHQDLLDAVRDSLRAVLDVKLQYLEESAMRTPANSEIAVNTPHAPDVLQMDYDQRARFEARKLLEEIKSGLNTFPEESTTTKVEVLDNVSSGDHANNNNKETKNANSLLLSTAGMQKDAGQFAHKVTLTHIVEETQQHVQKVVSGLRRMADILIPESRPEAHAVRRLSTMLNPSTKKPQPPLNQSLRTTIQRAKAARRSLAATANADDVVTTPTTSRPSMSMPPPPPTTTTKKPAAPTSKLAQHSVSFSTATTASEGKLHSRNPKYAHVQSTIPKHVVAKKKAT